MNKDLEKILSEKDRVLTAHRKNGSKLAECAICGSMHGGDSHVFVSIVSSSLQDEYSEWMCLGCFEDLQQ